MNVLIAEDDASVARFLKQATTEAGYTTQVESDGLDALQAAQAAAFDLVLLDVMLPRLDGFEICRRWRAAGMLAPVLIITAKDTTEDKIEGLDSGADDYIVKPFQVAELLARMRALQRRGIASLTLLRVGDLTLDPATRHAQRAGKSILLSATEYSLLEYLMRNVGRVLTRSMILDHVWQYDFGGNDNVLDVYVSYLRGKIDKGYPVTLLHTVRGVGFRLVSMKLNSMRSRMTANFAAAIAALMLFACSAFIVYEKQAARREADSTLAQAAQEIRHELSIGEHSLNNIPEFMKEEGEEMHERSLVLQIVDGGGQVIAQSQQKAPAWPLKGDSWRAATVNSGVYTVVISLHWAKTEREFRVWVLGLMALGVFMTVAAAAGSWIVVGHTLSPIGSLSRQARAASAESLQIRLDAPSQDAEVIELIETLNGLMARIGETAAARGRFYAAASHELRTPLQALCGHLEMGLSRPRSNEEYQTALTEAQEQAHRLSSLVQELLLLNQLELTTSVPPCEAVNLADICERVIAWQRDTIAAHDLKVESELQDFSFMAPMVHIEMLIRNLVENAVKYSTPGGLVQVSVRQGGRAAVVEIFNECRPVEGWSPDRYFEPFFRPDSSRNSLTGGNGLGLAICKAIAQANNWELNLTQEPGGVRAKILLSAAP